eukprot:jgi/Tetstr1/430959/TSEL_020714.t1
MALKDGIHLRLLVDERLGRCTEETLLLLEDNQPAISLANNIIISYKTKHIVKYHFLKDHVQADTVQLAYVATDDNVADMPTKPLPAPALAKHARTAMGRNMN